MSAEDRIVHNLLTTVDVVVMAMHARATFHGRSENEFRSNAARSGSAIINVHPIVVSNNAASGLDSRCFTNTCSVIATAGSVTIFEA